MKSDRRSPARRLFIGMLLFLTAAFAVTNLPCFLCGAIAALICLLTLPTAEAQQAAKGRGLLAPIPVRPLIPALVTGFCLLMPPLTVESGALWKYPIHRAVLGIYHNVQPSGLFPDFAGDVISDYHFSYLPSIMQGTGHFSVRFVTSADCAEQYEQAFRGQSVQTCLLSELDGGGSCRIGDCDAYTVWYDREFFADCPDAAVYICEAGTNPNHPHSTALIADKSTGKVQLSRLG